MFGRPRLSGTRRVGTNSLCVALCVSLESCVCVQSDTVPRDRPLINQVLQILYRVNRALMYVQILYIRTTLSREAGVDSNPAQPDPAFVILHT